MSFLEVRGLGKRFGDLEVLAGVELTVERGEVVALLGPSGSGKTTLLRVLAGFESADAGTLLVEGQEFGDQPPARRGFGMVFQHYALFPHLTVGENVAFGLHGRGLRVDGTGDRVARMLALVDLEGFEDRRVSEISGGQQQRVALARALAPEPRLLLLDEPLSNLDPELRERTRSRLKGTLREVGISTVLVTHEQDEAFDLGDRVAVLHGGRLEQIDRPEVLYRTPASRFVAGFVGRASLVHGERTIGGEVRVGRDAAGNEIVWSGSGGGALPPGAPVDVVVRPESLALVPTGAEGALDGRVLERRFSGSVSFALVELGQGGRLEVATAVDVEVGSEVGVALREGGLPPRIFARDAPDA